MKTFRQFITEATKKYPCKVIPYKMAPGGKACAKRSSSSAGGD